MRQSCIFESKASRNRERHSKMMLWDRLRKDPVDEGKDDCHYKWRLHLSFTKRLNNCDYMHRTRRVFRFDWSIKMWSNKHKQTSIGTQSAIDGATRKTFISPKNGLEIEDSKSYDRDYLTVPGGSADDQQKNTKDHETRHDMAWNLVWDPRRSNKGKTSTYFWKKIGR